MGIEFIRSKAGNIKKSWSGGVRKLAAPDLFTVQDAGITRSILADACTGATVQIKDQLVLECRENQIVAYRGTTQVAVHKNPPGDLLKALNSVGGCACGQVVRVLTRSQCVEIRIKE